MAYGKIKADAVIWDNSGSDVEESMSNIAGKLNAAGGAMTGNLTLNAQNELRLADSDSSNYIALKSPATVASNVTLTLPTTDGDADQYLQTNGSGVLTWADVAGGYTWASQITFDGDDTFSSIPTTVTEVVFLLDQLKTTTSHIRLQFGPSSGLTTTGYISHRGYFQTSTPNVSRHVDGFYLYGSGHTHTGIITFKRNSANNNWVMSGVQTMYDGGTAYIHTMAGRLDMGSNVLNQINVVSIGAGTYTGTISFGYK